MYKNQTPSSPILFYDSDNESLVNVSPSPLVELNISGTIFTFTRQQLEKFPELVFHKDFKNSDIPRDRMGRLFYGRHPQTFEIIALIINQYNFNDSFVNSYTNHQLELLFQDLNYYGFSEDFILNLRGEDVNNEVMSNQRNNLSCDDSEIDVCDDCYDRICGIKSYDNSLGCPNDSESDSDGDFDDEIQIDFPDENFDLSVEFVEKNLPMVVRHLCGDKYIHFDRSPDYFRIILDYLRGYQLNWDKFSDVELINLKKDAEFYEIIDLAGEIDKRYKIYSDEEKEERASRIIKEIDTLLNYKGFYLDILRQYFNDFPAVLSFLDGVSESLDTYRTSTKIKEIYKKVIKEFYCEPERRNVNIKNYSLWTTFFSEYLLAVFLNMFSKEIGLDKCENNSSQIVSTEDELNNLLNEYFPPENIEEKKNTEDKFKIESRESVPVYNFSSCNFPGCTFCPNDPNLYPQTASSTDTYLSNDDVSLFNVRGLSDKKQGAKIIEESYNELNNQTSQETKRENPFIQYNNYFKNTIETVKKVTDVVNNIAENINNPVPTNSRTNVPTSIEDIIKNIDAFLGNFSK